MILLIRILCGIAFALAAIIGAPIVLFQSSAFSAIVYLLFMLALSAVVMPQIDA